MKRICSLLVLGLALTALGCGNAGDKGKNKGLDIPKGEEPKVEETKK
jgi:hypothetical protein